MVLDQRVFHNVARLVNIRVDKVVVLLYCDRSKTNYTKGAFLCETPRWDSDLRFFTKQINPITPSKRILDFRSKRE